MTKNYKIIFCGNGPLAAKILLELERLNFKFNLILTGADKIIARGQRVKRFANRQEFSLILSREKPDLLVVADFGLIISKKNLAVPKYGCLNIHPSLLPKYRGPTPIQSAILAGDQETGITIIKMDEKVDHGKIIQSSKFKTCLPTGRIQSSKITYVKLSAKLAKLGAELLKNILPDYLEGKIQPIEQDHSQATFTKKIQKSDGQIDWSKSAEEIDRRVRALNPWPGAFTYFQGKRLIIHEGKIIDNQYIPTKVQMEGRKPISWEEFLRGQRMSEEEALKIIKMDS